MPPSNRKIANNSWWIPALEQAIVEPPSMKLTALFCLIAVLFLQSGCAYLNRPSGEEQDRQELKTEQSEKKSDAFAKQLPQ
jgi:hypothetical protein